MTSSEILQIIGRNAELFDRDITNAEAFLQKTIRESKFLVLGGAGSIGQAVTKEIFSRNPAKLHVVDISENNLVELVRDLRSSIGYIDGDFRTYALDIGSVEYDAMIAADGEFDYVLNLSALKHVRSEEDAFTLMRMIDVNITNTVKTIKQSIDKGTKKYFCVSTDKAANPVNMMGGSKRIMEMFLARLGAQIDISTARFANVAFSDGSLLHGFNNRLEKKQPIVAPSDVTRFFVTPKESGQLCLMSCMLGENGDTFFPKESEEFKLLPLDFVAKQYLKLRGLEATSCNSEQEARSYFASNDTNSKWPCYFPKSDTTGEKEFEEFFTDDETLDMERFINLGVIKNEFRVDDNQLNKFEERIIEMRKKGAWRKQEIVELFHDTLPSFDYYDKGKYLDSKM